MNKKEILGIVGQETDFTTLYGVMMASIAHQEDKITPKERADRKEESRIKSEQREKRAKVIKNICPDCNGKLSRGKKDKKNNYKRFWTCKDCGNSHSA